MNMWIFIWLYWLLNLMYLSKIWCLTADKVQIKYTYCCINYLTFTSLHGCVVSSFIKKEKKKINKYSPSQTENSHLPVLSPYLSVTPWFLVLKGWQAFQTSSSPSKKYPSSCHNPTIPPLPLPPSLLGPPNKNKVGVKWEWPGLLLCRSVSGYLIVTHGLPL